MSAAYKAAALCALFAGAMLVAAPRMSLAQEVSEEELGKGSTDFVGASPVYSIDLSRLKKSPLEVRVSFIPELVPLIRDHLSEKAFARQLHKYLARLESTLPVGSGMLLRYRVLTDEFGNSTLPVDFLVPIGAGMNPVDAYAEFLNRPAIVPAPVETTAVDTGHYVWVERTQSPTLQVAAIPREFNRRLELDGRRLATEKVRLRAIGRPYVSYKVPDYVARAEYWQKLVAEREARLVAAGQAKLAKDLAERFQQLQQHHQALVSVFRERQRQLSETNAFLNTAGLLLDLGSKVASAAEGNSSERTSLDVKSLQVLRGQLAAEVDEYDTRIKNTSKDLKRTDEALLKVPELM